MDCPEAGRCSVEVCLLVAYRHYGELLTSYMPFTKGSADLEEKSNPPLSMLCQFNLLLFMAICLERMLGLRWKIFFGIAPVQRYIRDLPSWMYPP
jgi:hypothetical protein